MFVDHIGKHRAFMTEDGGSRWKHLTRLEGRQSSGLLEKEPADLVYGWRPGH